MPNPMDVALKPQAAPLDIELPIDGIGSEAFWLNEVEQAEKRKKAYLPLWRTNLERYNNAHPALTGIKSEDVISVNADFYNAEQKKAQLFYQTPKVILTPKRTGDQGQTLEEAGVVEAAVLNHYLGPDQIDAEALVEQVLSDVLVPAGISFTKIGYESIIGTQQVPTGRTVPGPVDPMTGMPGMPTPALGPDGQPETTEVPKVMWDRYYWEEISPARALWPASFASTRFEKAPWLGWEFQIDADRISREYRIDRSLIIDGTQDDRTLVPEKDKPFVKAGSTGYEIYYRGAIYDPTVQSPDLYRRLVILEQSDGRRVCVHSNSPYQQFDPVTGQLTKGMKGNPIHPCALRTMTDQAIPNSDCTQSRSQVDELSMGRSQMVLQRKRNIPVRGFNKLAIEKATITAIERGEIQSMIPFDGPIQAQDFQVLANATFPRENFDFDTIVNRDVEKIWAIGSNQLGVRSTGDETATAANLQSAATETRMAKERNNLLKWYLRGCQKLFALVQLFATEQQVIQIAGPDGAKRAAVWNKDTIAGEYAFEISPDSSERIDASERLNKLLRLYNLTANDPNINRAAMNKNLLVEFGMDPALVMQSPPPPPPDKPKINLSFKGEDLSNPLVLRFLKESGAPVTDADIAAATAVHTGVPISAQPMAGQPPGALPAGLPSSPVTLPHGGRAVQATMIDKHGIGDGR